MTSLAMPRFTLACHLCKGVHAIDETALTQTVPLTDGTGAVSSWLDVEPSAFWSLAGGYFRQGEPVRNLKGVYSIPMYVDVIDGSISSHVDFSILFDGCVYSKTWERKQLLSSAHARGLLDLIGPPDIVTLAELDMETGRVVLDELKP